ncbi:MAG: hypothetical protein Q9207_006300 [Kuettlingeria erythrocarpa]
MEAPYFEPLPAAPPRPGYAPPIPGGWPTYGPVQGYGQPYSSNPYAAYALPILRPPVASHTRHQRHHLSRKGNDYRDQRRSQARGRTQSNFARGRQRGSSSAARDYGQGSSSEDILTDVSSVDSDSSEAVSANSFVFDGSISDIGKGQTENGPTALTWGTEIFERRVEGRRKAPALPPSPYSSSGASILFSKFEGDAVPQWNYCTADLSIVASEDSLRLKKEPLFRWVYVSDPSGKPEC